VLSVAGSRPADRMGLRPGPRPGRLGRTQQSRGRRSALIMARPRRTIRFKRARAAPSRADGGIRPRRNGSPGGGGTPSLTCSTATEIQMSNAPARGRPPRPAQRPGAPWCRARRLWPARPRRPRTPATVRPAASTPTSALSSVSRRGVSTAARHRPSRAQYPVSVARCDALPA
jgi:hypothetical protein